MNYVTDNGMNKMLDDLKNMKFVQRAAATERLKIARKHGDLRENGDYKAAREEIAQIDAKIGRLENIISNSSIVKPEDIQTDKIQIFNTIEIKDHTRNRLLKYTLVSQEEADPLENKISADSPIGKGLLGKKTGERVIISVPAGDLEFEILSIK